MRHAPPRREQTCFSNGRAASQIRDAAIANYGATGPSVLDGDTTYTHNQWQVIETFEHSYHTVADGPWASAQGHCIPGSTMDPYAPQYAIPCQLPNSFVWGQQVMTFFLAHPLP